MLDQVKRKLLLCCLIFAGLIFSVGCAGTKQATVDPNSIYARLGGQPAIDAAVELFYKKVLADKSVSQHFEGVDMDRQRKRQKQFLAKAFGGPDNYKGKNMRDAHKRLDLKESDFNAIAGHLQATLKELKINDKLIGEAMAVAASTKDEVLNK